MTPRDILQLTATELHTLEGAIEKRLAMSPSPSTRRQARARLERLGKIVVELRGGSAPLMAFFVPPLDLDERGMSFLHAKFVYPGTVCTAKLRTLEGLSVGITGHVMRCSLVSGRVHEVGVKFEHTINVGLFLSDSDGESSVACEVAAGELWNRVRGLADKLGHAVTLRDGMAAASFAGQIEQLCLLAASDPA